MTTVGLVQINSSFSGQEYLPTAIGSLVAYAKRHLTNSDDVTFLIPLHKRYHFHEMVACLADTDLIGFSTYVWNYRISTVLAAALKKRDPNRIIVFGGPHVPDRSEKFLREHPYIDIVCHGEGEEAFLQILERYQTGDWSSIPSISYIDREGRYCVNRRADRIHDLAAIPSPYLTGVFDELMRLNQGVEWLVPWETNRGCPFSCAFCDWGSSTASKVFKFDLSTLYEELEWFGKNQIPLVWCCDANFGIFPRDVDIARKAADVKERYGYPKTLTVQNAKNAEERIFEAQYILAGAGLGRGVTLAFQSRDSHVLEDIKRANISSDDFRNLQKRFTEAGIPTYSDMILALPGETYDSFADGVARTIEEGQHNRIQFSNLTILPNAEMGDPSYQARYGMETVEVLSTMYHALIADDPDGIYESEDIVVATNAMPREDWVRTRVFSWVAALLHFDKLFQVPFIVLHETTGVSYRDLIEVFTEGDLDGYPVLAELRGFLVEKARGIQRGDIANCPASQWLNVYWIPDEYIFIKLCTEGKLDEFYKEAEKRFVAFFRERGIDVSKDLFRECIEFTRNLIKLPFRTEDLEIILRYNIWEFYEARLRSIFLPLCEGRFRYRIDRTQKVWTSWEQWFKEVVWLENKMGGYLYRVIPENRT